MFIFVLNISASNVIIKHNIGQYSEGTKHESGHVTFASDDDHYYAHKIILAAGGQFLKIGFGHVTSASDDDHYYAHKIILAARGPFLKIKKEIISYSLFVQDLWL